MRTPPLWLSPVVGILVFASPLRAVPLHQWSKQFGESASPSAVATDGVGNVVMTGTFYDTVDFGGGPFTSAGQGDIFVAKFGPNGNHIWSYSFGDSLAQSASDVAVDGSGNIVITGTIEGAVDFGGGFLACAVDTGQYHGNVLVVKFDADGDHLWSYCFGDTSLQVGNSVAVDASDNVFITGNFVGTIDFGGGTITSNGGNIVNFFNEIPVGDVFVASFDADGNHVWSRGYGDSEAQLGFAIAADALGNVVLTGDFYGTLDFGGGDLVQTCDFFCQRDVFVAKLDANGNHIWSQGFGDDYSQFGRSIAVDGAGNVVVAGEFFGAVDFGGGALNSNGGTDNGDLFVTKFDVNGSHLWSHSFGDTLGQVVSEVAVGNSGNVDITGAFEGTVDFGGGPLSCSCLRVSFYPGHDAFVARFDPDGVHLWSQRFGDDGLQVGNAMAEDVSGNVVIAGGFFGTVDFGGGPLTGSGLDMFLAKFGDVVPVLITNFAAKAHAGVVEVTWEVWSDESLESFTLYRTDDAHPSARVIAAGRFDDARRSYIDASVEAGRKYSYELLIHTQDGDDIRSLVATATVPALRTTLGQNFPNPFKPTTTIEYTLSEPSSTVLGIYDAAGRLIVRLDQGVREAGAHSAEWNGRDAGGRAVGSGVYFYRLEGAPNVAPKKMVLLK